MKLMLVAITLVSVQAFGKTGTIEQKKKALEWEGSVAKSSTLLNEKCGVAIAANIESATYIAEGFIEAKKNPGEICKTSVYHVRMLCEDAVAKSVVVEKIKKIKCVAAKGEEVNLSIQDGTLNIGFGPNAKNVAEKTRDYLKSNL